MDWNYYRSDSDFFDDTSSTPRSRSTADQVTHAYVERLETKLDNLALACQSLWEILRDSTDLTEKELAAKMEEIDIRDGMRDGKITPTSQSCKSCGRKTSRKRSKCIYCGKPTPEVGETFGR